MKHKVIKEKRVGGFTEWIDVHADGYRLVCCDCGLAHDLRFRVREKEHCLDRRTVQIQFQARRNVRSTAAVRREDKKRLKAKA